MRKSAERGGSVAGKTAAVTSKGQVTIPAEVRDYLEVKTGDRLLFVRDADRVYIERSPGKTTAREAFGALASPDQAPVDVDKARAEARAARVRRADGKPTDEEGAP
jgi:AbrB family looped-hinge helix DNA binding protein